MFYYIEQSYAGKYVPAIGYKIHMSNPTAMVKINLAGISIGDALIDPETVRMFSWLPFCLTCTHTTNQQLGGYADLLYNIGMADKMQQDQLQQVTDIAIQHIKDQNYREAFEVLLTTCHIIAQTP